MVCAIDPPVASIGSSTITGLPRQVVGQRLQIRLGQVGFLVAGDADESHLRLRHAARCAASTMPSPARNTGTSSGGLASRVPTVSATGVRIRDRSRGASRVAS